MRGRGQEAPQTGRGGQRSERPGLGVREGVSTRLQRGARARGGARDQTGPTPQASAAASPLGRQRGHRQARGGSMTGPCFRGSSGASGRQPGRREARRAARARAGRCGRGRGGRGNPQAWRVLGRKKGPVPGPGLLFTVGSPLYGPPFSLCLWTPWPQLPVSPPAGDPGCLWPTPRARGSLPPQGVLLPGASPGPAAVTGCGAACAPNQLAQRAWLSVDSMAPGPPSVSASAHKAQGGNPCSPSPPAPTGVPPV